MIAWILGSAVGGFVVVWLVFRWFVPTPAQKEMIALARSFEPAPPPDSKTPPR